jgi:hypothetical protein
MHQITFSPGVNTIYFYPVHLYVLCDWQIDLHAKRRGPDDLIMRTTMIGRGSSRPVETLLQML